MSDCNDIGNRMLSRLERFADSLERGEAIPVSRMTSLYASFEVLQSILTEHQRAMLVGMMPSSKEVGDGLPKSNASDHDV